jgi:predicted nucleic acid-binding protein
MAMTSDKRSIFLDTNIIIRANVISAPFHPEALAAIQKLQETNTPMWISRQVLREYMSAVTRDQTFMRALSPDVVIARVQYFEAHFKVADDHAQITASLLKLLSAVPVGGKQIHDANIVATMQTYGISDLLTLNRIDFERFGAYITVLSLEDIAKLP